MRGAGDHRDLLAFELLGPHVVRSRRRGAPRSAAGRAVIRIAEIGELAGLRRDGDRGHHGVAAVVGERRQQRIEPPHLDGAGDFQLLADHPREIDVEAGRIAVGTGVVERRIVDLGDEADQRDARQVRPLRPPPRVPEARDDNGARSDRRAACCRQAIARGADAANAAAKPTSSRRHRAPTRRPESRNGSDLDPSFAGDDCESNSVFACRGIIRDSA